MFDFAENLIAQQRAFAKQILRAASSGQQAIADTTTETATEVPTEAITAAGAASTPDTPSATAARGTRAKPTPAP